MKLGCWEAQLKKPRASEWFVKRYGSMTRATSDGLSESRRPSWWRVFSSDGVHFRVGLMWFDADIIARLIRVAKSVVGLIVIGA